MTTRVPTPPYGSVEAFARILKHTQPEYIEVAALGIVEMIADDGGYDDALKIGRIRNVAAAVALVRGDEPPADRTGLAYTRADDDAEDPTQPGPREPLHTGGMTDGGLVDETGADPGVMAMQEWDAHERSEPVDQTGGFWRGN